MSVISEDEANEKRLQKRFQKGGEKFHHENMGTQNHIPNLMIVLARCFRCRPHLEDGTTIGGVPNIRINIAVPVCKLRNHIPKCTHAGVVRLTSLRQHVVARSMQNVLAKA